MGEKYACDDAERGCKTQNLSELAVGVSNIVVEIKDGKTQEWVLV